MSNKDLQYLEQVDFEIQYKVYRTKKAIVIFGPRGNVTLPSTKEN